MKWFRRKKQAGKTRLPKGSDPARASALGIHAQSIGGKNSHKNGWNPDGKTVALELLWSDKEGAS